MDKILPIILIMLVSTNAFSSSDWTEQEKISSYKGCMKSSLENSGWISEDVGQLKRYCACVTNKVSKKYAAAQIYRDASVLEYEMRPGGIYDACLNKSSE